jgi:hypothetical protein
MTYWAACRGVLSGGSKGIPEMEKIANEADSIVMLSH